MPDKARKTMAKADDLFGVETSAIAKSVVTEAAINRFERFANLAAQQVTGTFKDKDATEKFYSLSGIVQTANSLTSAKETPAH